MCLAIYKPAATAPDWNAYENGHSSNDDSWGFAVVTDSGIITRCGLGNFAEFREAFEPYADKQAIIHFRWATHGSKTEANCHPFWVSKDLVVIHNGIIGIKCDLHKDRSDTWHFTELVLRPMCERDPDFFLHSDVIYSQEMAHKGSKFAFLRADGQYGIWNEEDGDWAADGHWYSNDSHRHYYGRYAKYTPTTTSTTRYVGFNTAGSASSGTSRSSLSRFDDWEDSADERWKKIMDDDAIGLRDTDDDEDEDDEPLMSDDQEEAFYSTIRESELLSFGFSRDTLAEVFKLLGHGGLEALHDAM